MYFTNNKLFSSLLIKNMSYTFVKEIASGTYGKVSLVQQNGKSYADKEFFQHVDLNELDLLSRPSSQYHSMQRIL